MTETALEPGLLVGAFLFGMRHGLDVDHLAAIADIAGVAGRIRRSVFLSTIYALGHAAVVAALGVAAIAWGRYLPPALDRFMERFVGATLILLGVYLAYSIATRGSGARVVSRWGLLTSGARWMRRKERGDLIVIEHEHKHETDGHHLSPPHDIEAAATAPPSTAASTITKVATHTHPHVHVGRLPTDPLRGVGVRGALGTGIVHGIGAETPTQVLLFLTAAGVGAVGGGFLVLGAFILGLLVTNTAVALVCAAGSRGGRDAPVLYLVLAAVTAVLSIGIGTLYLVGRADALANLFG